MTKRLTEDEWRDLDDLRLNWYTFCDAEPFEGRDTFTERMETRGWITIRKVRKADLEESFAAERGIEPGGMVWELTKKGYGVIERPKKA